MIRIASRGKVLGMTPDAICRRPRISSIYMTIQTIQARMCSRQGEACEPRVIEPGSVPRIHPVAGLAGGGQMRSRMIGIFCGLVIL